MAQEELAEQGFQFIQLSDFTFYHGLEGLKNYLLDLETSFKG